MARTQAADFEERRMAIVEQAATLFAERGFLGASIADLAQACGISKSLVYHYYAAKEDILFDVMHSHVKALLDAAEEIAEQPIAAAERLRAITAAFMRLYIGAASRQRVLLNELQSLPKSRRMIVVGVQRRLINIVQAILLEIRPQLSRHSPLKRPAAMLYFGMVNWTHTWLDPEGRANPSKIAELAANIFLKGIEKSEIPE
ncbi:MAG TPA: TetR/AcrR family transcriptional regulator [Rhizomicrobium sp.]|nr:TetR/AcrR family transcriptional regulator [Rhizomicrobium sp.]